MHQHPITIEGHPGRFACAESTALLGALSPAGRGPVRVGCRSGGCGVCRVQVLRGRYVTGDMSSAQISAEDRGRKVALACRLFPREALEVRVLGRKAMPGQTEESKAFARFFNLCREDCRS